MFKWEKIGAILVKNENTSRLILAIAITLFFLLIINVFLMIDIQIIESAKILIELTVAFIGFCGLFAVYLFTDYDNRITLLSDKIADREFELKKFQCLTVLKDCLLELEIGILNERKKEIIQLKNKCYSRVFQSFIYLMLSLCFSLIFYSAIQLGLNQITLNIIGFVLAFLLSLGVTCIFGLILQIGRNRE
ncbi:MAG: hypothetical protein FWB84_05610 [Candidatus Bathyarchaeota archaeon]|uniref:hypothetical protein n=1 Tax=Candidatus Bathycorpusculum sp. TaxID=2994959 RepID=UPI002833C5E8|nr:hypothetical protein [Candidatus Termiticorpusculum sp.]MCL2257956.1 hypothetical protein [Candidatus Termiticorpusculum sp.]